MYVTQFHTVPGKNTAKATGHGESARGLPGSRHAGMAHRGFDATQAGDEASRNADAGLVRERFARAAQGRGCLF
ncbi:hypothetical protein D3C81_2104280 [compost metagenome]